jgi:hypothetical protein
MRLAKTPNTGQALSNNRWLTRAPLCAAAALLLSACGYVGGPLPPLANIPGAVANLAAVQRSSRLIVHFTVPALTTEGVAIKPPVSLDLRIGPAAEPFRIEDWAAHATKIPSGDVTKGLATYDIATALWTGKQVVLAVRVAGANGRESDWSNRIVLPIVPPPAKPAGVRAESTAAGVRLEWSGPGDYFRIFRKTAAEGFTPLAKVSGEHAWTDPATEFGKSYTYLVQNIVDLGGNREAESDLSDPFDFTPRDVFPPAAPTGLNPTVAPNSIELTWEQNTEPDLAGYHVYRAAPGSDFEKLADISLVPSFSDKTAERGKTYRYSITAIDQAGNESARSAIVESALQ